MTRRLLVVGALDAGPRRRAARSGGSARGAAAVTVDEIGDQVQTRPARRAPRLRRRRRTAPRSTRSRPSIPERAAVACRARAAASTLGHVDNRLCYIKAETPAQVTYTSHAAT